MERVSTTEKQCNRCGVSKPRTEFYSRPKMVDGLLGQCKQCYCENSRRYYTKNRAHYEHYYHTHPRTPERTEQANRLHRERHPEKVRAHNATNNAIRDGRLFRQPCEKCGAAKVEAHHDDYTKQLEVRWLCRKHHLEHHGKRAY